MRERRKQTTAPKREESYNDRLDAEALNAAKAALVGYLKPIFAENKHKLLRNLSHVEAEGMAAAAIAGWVGKRAEQAQAQHIDPGDWNDFIGQRGAYAFDDPIDDLFA